MLVVRNRFVAKPGCAGKLAAQLKEAVAAFGMPNARVLTDVTGDFKARPDTAWVDRSTRYESLRGQHLPATSVGAFGPGIGAR